MPLGKQAIEPACDCASENPNQEKENDKGGIPDPTEDNRGQSPQQADDRASDGPSVRHGLNFFLKNIVGHGSRRIEELPKAAFWPPCEPRASRVRSHQCPR